MRDALSAPLTATLDAYTRYLAAERGLAAATVTAYTADVAALLDHLGRLAGGTSPDSLDGLTLAVLRSWLAKQRTTGSKRASMGRRAAAGKSFTTIPCQRLELFMKAVIFVTFLMIPASTHVLN